MGFDERFWEAMLDEDPETTPFDGLFGEDAFDGLPALLAGGGEHWEPEIIRLGQRDGLTVERRVTSDGIVVFTVAEGAVSAEVYKARGPDVTLDGVAVYLVEELADGGTRTGRYAIMVDDPYWGRRVQPAQFEEAPFAETFVMGYRVKGRVLQDGEAVGNAKVSLEGTTSDDSGVTSTFWDSLEFNELIWSEALATWVEGPTVHAPIMTDAEGRWSFICPKGEGAIYQRAGDRRDESPETAAQPVQRWVAALRAVYHGRKVELTEDVEAVIDILSGRLEVTGEAGAWIKVGTLDEDGQAYLVPESGTVVIEGLPSGEHGVVQFRRNAWGEWDSTLGCARVSVTVAEGATATVDLGSMTAYDPGASVIAGRVYTHMGHPASGIPIVTLNYETGEIGEAIATTDAGGYWEAGIPPEGLAGDPWVHSETWGSLPVLGFPYSDVVLGARAYAAYQEEFKPEAWRKGDRGHSNFQFIQDGIWVKDNASGEVYGTAEVAYGGWVTTVPLPKYQYVADPLDLLLHGPQLREYSLYSGEELLEASFGLRSQSFSEYEELPGQFRAAGYYPESKFLIGGKIRGSTVVGDEAPIGVELPEALRVGLEFGQHEWYVQLRQERSGDGEGVASCWTDLVCPYCGAPAWRDPDGGGYQRGYCGQCAAAFGRSDAMDCRTHFLSPGLRAGADRYRLHITRRQSGGGMLGSEARYHWRPDLYDESDTYLTQGGIGQATNAPRWFARHVDQVADGKGFGRFDLASSPEFTPGHSLGYFGDLPEVDRELGLTQLKLRFPSDYRQQSEAVVAVDCRRGDGTVETVEVVIPAGTRGPSEGDALGQVLRLTPVAKVLAEAKTVPYEGVGLYTEVVDVRVVRAPEAGGCKFTIINDVPLLATAEGIRVRDRRPSHVALQIGFPGSDEPHLLDDAVGQVFLFYARGGSIWMTRRAGLRGTWGASRVIADGPGSGHPAADKDGTGRLLLVWEKAGALAAAESLDDGGQWWLA
jgi:hypothetical protein